MDTNLDATIRRILEGAKTIAVVGASANPDRPSYRVMGFLKDHGYKVYPINPGFVGSTIHGEPVHNRLADIADRIDMVDIFRRSEEAGQYVDQAIAIGAKAAWMQLGVRDDDAAARGRAAGLDVVVDRCPAIEIPRLAIHTPDTAIKA